MSGENGEGISVRYGDCQRTFTVEPGKPLRIVVRKEELAVNFIEIEDLLFNYDSAFLLPAATIEEGGEEQKVVQGIDVFVKVYKFLSMEGNSGKRCLIAGHTDAAGKPAYNSKLSEYRATCFRLVLERSDASREQWMDLYRNDRKDGVSTYRIEDVQSVLNWAESQYGWGCGGLKVDGITGPETKNGIRKFKAGYNSKFAPDHGGKQLNRETHSLERKMWGAIYDLYQKSIDDRLAAIDLPRGEILWVDDERPAVGCGEVWPVEKLERIRAGENPGDVSTDPDKKNQMDRRVEILFFDEREADSIVPLGCAGSGCTGSGCRVYGDSGGKRKFVPVYLWETFYVRLHTEGSDDPLRDFSFTLYSESGGYSMTKTAGGGGTDQCADLAFTDLAAGLRYSMKVDPGEGGNPYFLFQDVPLGDLDKISPPDREEPDEEDEATEVVYPPGEEERVHLIDEIDSEV